MNEHYALGIIWHSAAEVLLKGGSGEEAYRAAAAVAEHFPLPSYWHNWLLAAYLAWERSKRDDFFSEWEVLSIEEEFEIPISPNVVLYTRADAVVRSRSDGSAWVLNWKTASDVKDWTKKWFFDPQGWTEAIAAESKLGVEISGCIYLGVWKGPMYQGKSTSRLMGGYKHPTIHPWYLLWPVVLLPLAPLRPLFLWSGSIVAAYLFVLPCGQLAAFPAHHWLSRGLEVAPPLLGLLWDWRRARARRLKISAGTTSSCSAALEQPSS